MFHATVCLKELRKGRKQCRLKATGRLCRGGRRAILPSRGHLAVSGDMFIVTAQGMPLASSGWRLRMLAYKHSIMQRVASFLSPLQQRIIQPQMSTVLMLRQSDTEVFGKAKVWVADVSAQNWN